MTGFWSTVSRHWPPCFPSWEWRRRIGEAEMSALLAARVLHERAIRPYESVVCPDCSHNARVIWEAGRALAICEGEMMCEVVDLGPTPARLYVDGDEFARRLGEALGLVGVPGTGAFVVPLGRRKLGDEWVAFDVCTHPGRDGVAEALQCLARGGPPVRVVLVPHSSRIRASLPAEICGIELLWVGIDEVVTLADPLRVDLVGIASRRPFRGFVAATPFDGLEVRADGVVWRGLRPVAQPSPLALRLLRILAEHAEDLRTRRQLSAAIWPDEHTRSGGLARGTNPDDIDRRLRNLVAELREALGSERIENRRGGPDVGGYRLVLPAGRVRLA